MSSITFKMPYSIHGLKELYNYDAAFRKTENVLDIMKEYYSSPNDVTVNAEGSKIIEFYKGKHVFLTGGTGFVGTLTVEKLLRACPDIGRIYLMIRNKKNKDIKTRMEKYFKNSVFDPLRKIFPRFEEKVFPLNGDLEIDNLGLSDEDQQTLINNAQIIIHGAATVNFDEKFRVSVNINVRGTQKMLQFAKKCKNLLIFVHVSSAFSTDIHKQVKEEVHEYQGSIEEILDVVEKYPDVELEIMAKRYKNNFANVYAFTKHLAESVVKKSMDELPIVIFRPSMILTTYREPHRGWSNNIYGPLAVLFLGGIGLQHVVLANPDSHGNDVPADYTVNCLIAVIYKSAQNQRHRKKVYNFVSRPCIQFSWQEICQNSLSFKLKIPSKLTKLHVYCAGFTTNENLYLIGSFFFHYMPAVLIDVALQVAGIKTPMKVKDGIKKLDKMMLLVKSYTTLQWKFAYDNVDELWQELSWADRNAFPFNVQEVHPKLFLICNVLGLRTFFTKEPLSTITSCRKNYQRIEYAYYCFYAIASIILFILLNKIYNFLFL